MSSNDAIRTSLVPLLFYVIGVFTGVVVNELGPPGFLLLIIMSGVMLGAAAMNEES